MKSGFSGLAIAIQTPLPRGPLRAASPLPSATYPPLRSGAFRQRPSCERNPHLSQLGRWPLARRRWRCALLILKLPLRVPSGAAFICASRFPNGGSWDFHPAPDGACARVVPKETFDWRCPIGRGSPFKVLVKPRFSGRCFASLALFRLRLNRAQIADSPRGRGRRGRRSRPKPSVAFLG